MKAPRSVVAALAFLLIPAGSTHADGGSSATTGSDSAPALRRAPFTIDPSDTGWWSFQPVRRPSTPAGNEHPIDALLRQQLAARGLSPNPPASPRERIRRLYFDVIGLPPSAEDVASFESNPSPEAWAGLVDQLLADADLSEQIIRTIAAQRT